MAMRAAESPARSHRIAWSHNLRNSKAGRTWYDWLPIHGLETPDVFKIIRAAGQEPHWAYAAGMSRLSCSDTPADPNGHDHVWFNDKNHIVHVGRNLPPHLKTSRRPPAHRACAPKPAKPTRVGGIGRVQVSARQDNGVRIGGPCADK